MKRIGICGIGDMGSGLAKNLIAAGFTVSGFDPDPARLTAFKALGGVPVSSPAAAGEGADAVFVMVMNAAQLNEVVFGGDDHGGLVSSMAKGATIITTATILPADLIKVAQKLAPSGIDLVDSPVSGGFPGAQGGTLVMMAAGRAEVLEKVKPAMEAVSAKIQIVGDTPGMGQTVKACLQALIGGMFSATYEASALAAKSGISGEVFLNVVEGSSANSLITTGSLSNIIDGKFEKTGSHINTMYKDLTIASDHARNMGVPMFTAAMAMQLFQAAITKFPDADNQTVARVSEDIIGTGLRR